MSDRDNEMAQMLMAAARGAGWKFTTAVWNVTPSSIAFTFLPPNDLPFGIAVQIDETLWEADTLPMARFLVAGDAIKAAQRNAALNGFDPTGPARAVTTAAQD